MNKDKNQKITLDGLAKLVRTEIGGVKKDIGSLKRDVLRIDKKVDILDKKVTKIKKDVEIMKEYETELNLEERVDTIEKVFNIPTSVKENGI